MRIGVLGAGQLGLMLGQAGRKLGIECRFLDPAGQPPALRVGEVIRAAYDDSAALGALAAACDVLTYEFENVPVDAFASLDAGIAVRPPAAALRLAQDRLSEKRLFEELGIAIPAYASVDRREDLPDAIAALGLPLVVKTRRMGYDGKGQVVVHGQADIERVASEIGFESLIAEQFVDFDCELSVIGARSLDGDVAIYPLTRNVHEGGILRLSTAPAELPALEPLATEYMTRLLARLDYVGVLALELFAVGDRLLANEFAPRVHNSGHWTIEGAETSQFENHLRAVAGMRLGPTACRGHAGMVNLIGTIPAAMRNAATGDRASLHDYGKSPRPGRKLGHVTVVAVSAAERDRLLAGLPAV